MNHLRGRRRSPLDCLSLLLLHHGVQTANMRQDLNHKLVAVVEGDLGLATPADASRRSGNAESL